MISTGAGAVLFWKGRSRSRSSATLFFFVYNEEIDYGKKKTLLSKAEVQYNVPVQKGCEPVQGALGLVMEVHQTKQVLEGFVVFIHRLRTR